jgi:SAM-dependent methyltransferase
MPDVDYNIKYSNRSKGLQNSLFGKLFKKLYIHPSRFYGDLQHFGITNWHQRVKSFVDQFPDDSKILDAGSGGRIINDNIISADLTFDANLDFVGDLHNLPLFPESMDGIILQMVLEHVKDPNLVIEEMYRLLKPGGFIYCETPFLYPVHDRIDYRRWTHSGLTLLCGKFKRVDSGISIGPISTLITIARRHITLYFTSIYLEAAIDLILGWILWPFKYLDEILPKPKDLDIVAGGVYYIGQKERRDG